MNQPVKFTIDLNRFTAADQQGFAEVSGDFNPIHLDEAFARKTMVGMPVVHGMHLIIRLLDRTSNGLAISKLRASFVAPARVGEELEAMVSVSDGRDFQARIVRKLTGKLLANCSWQLDEEATTAHEFPDHALFSPRLPDALSLDKEFEGTQPLNGDGVGRSRPEYSSGQTRFLMGISTIVGMKAPGLDSLLGSVDLSRVTGSDCDHIAYRRKSYDSRFGMLQIGVEGLFLGEVTAFKLPSLPEVQPTSLQPIKALEGEKALVIGGSRGIGAACVTLLAISGAETQFTWVNGKQEAAALVDALPDCKVSESRFDLCSYDQEALELIASRQPEALYFFATPFIFEGDGSVFQRDLFDRFSFFYVTGFCKLVEDLIAAGAPLKRIFYPSSVAVEDFPIDMAEYAAAKLAGESACAYLQKRFPSLRIKISRLPRTETSQTLSVAPVVNQSPYEVMRPLLEDIARLT